MTDLTPEDRRDAAIAAVITAGGSILSTTPLASPADPTVIVAYRIDAGAPDLATLDALDAVRAETELDLAGLVPWVPPVIEEPVDA